MYHKSILLLYFCIFNVDFDFELKANWLDRKNLYAESGNFSIILLLFDARKVFSFQGAIMSILFAISLKWALLVMETSPSRLRGKGSLLVMRISFPFTS